MAISRRCLRCGAGVLFLAEQEAQGVVCQGCGAWIIPPRRRIARSRLDLLEPEEDRPNYAGVLRGLYLTSILIFFVCLGVPALTMKDFPLHEGRGPNRMPQFAVRLSEFLMFVGLVLPFCLFCGWWCLIWDNSSKARDWITLSRWLALGWSVLCLALMLISLPFRLMP